MLVSPGSTRRSVTRMEIELASLAARSGVPAEAEVPAPTSAGVAATATAATVPTKDLQVLVLFVLMQLHLSWGPQRTAFTR